MTNEAISSKVSVHAPNIKISDVKKIATENESTSKRVPLAQIEVDTTGMLSVGGIRLNSDEKILNQLYKVLCLNKTFVKKFGKLTDEKTTKALIELIKSGLVLRDATKQDIVLVGNPRTGALTHILPGNKDFISSSFGLDMIQKVLEKYPQLHVSGYSIDSDNGGVGVSLKSNVEVTPINRNGFAMKGEGYNPGINFNINPFGGLSTEAYTYRLVCTNGMVVCEMGVGAKIAALSDLSIEKFFEHIQHQADNNFVPFQYGEKLDLAKDTKASFGELLFARNMMMRDSDLKGEEYLQPHLPEFTSEVRKLAAKGYDYANLSERTLSNYPVKCTVWDVVNRMTEFGSHDYGFNTYFDSLQQHAGSLFSKKEYDTQGLVLLN